MEEKGEVKLGAALEAPMAFSQVETLAKGGARGKLSVLYEPSSIAVVFSMDNEEKLG